MYVRRWQRGETASGSPPRWRVGGLRVALASVVLLAVALGIAVRSGAPSAATARSLVGQPAPAVALPPLDGDRAGVEPVALAGASGRSVLIVFAYSLCPRCLQETQTAAAIAGDASPSGARVLLIDSPAESPAIVAAYLQRVHVAKSGVSVLLDVHGDAARAYHVDLYPTAVLIDSHGVVRAVWVGETSAEALRTALDRLADGTAGRSNG